MSNEDFQKLMLSKLDKLDTIENSIKEMKTDINSMKEDITGIKTQLDENTQIVRALMHSAEVNKADHDKMANDIAHMQGDIKSIQKDTDSIEKALSVIEEVTAKNWTDINKMKKAK